MTCLVSLQAFKLLSTAPAGEPAASGTVSFAICVALIQRVQPRMTIDAAHALAESTGAAGDGDESLTPVLSGGRRTLTCGTMRDAGAGRREFFGLCSALKGTLVPAASSWPGGDPAGCPVLCNLQAECGLDPVWNERLVFDCPDFPEFVTVAAYDKDPHGDEIIGQGILSLHAHHAQSNGCDWSLKAVVQLHDTGEQRKPILNTCRLTRNLPVCHRHAPRTDAKRLVTTQAMVTRSPLAHSTSG